MSDYEAILSKNMTECERIYQFLSEYEWILENSNTENP